MILKKELEVCFIVPTEQYIKEIESKFEKYGLEYIMTYKEPYHVLEYKIIYKLSVVLLEEIETEKYLLDACDDIFKEYEECNPFFMLDK